MQPLRYDAEHVRRLFAQDASIPGYGFHEMYGDVPIVEIELDTITDTNQSGHSPERLHEMLTCERDRRPLRLLAEEDRLTIWDGTHRVMAAQACGEQTILAQVLQVDCR